MKSSKASSTVPAKGQPQKGEPQENASGKLKLNTMADLALLRLQNAAESARKHGVAHIDESGVIDESGAIGWIVRFAPLSTQG